MATWILKQTISGKTYFKNYETFLDDFVNELAKEDKDKSEILINACFSGAEFNFKAYLHNPEYHETQIVVSGQNYKSFCQEAKSFIRNNDVGEYAVIKKENDGYEYYHEGVRRYLLATLMEDETL